MAHLRLTTGDGGGGVGGGDGGGGVGGGVVDYATAEVDAW